jgi:dihydroxyacetone kinase
MGLDPFTKPFDILRLNGKEVLYCTRSGTQQLNKLHKVSHTITSRDTNADAGVYIVTSKASLPDGRCTESIGAVNIAGLKGEAYANAIMKAETKAKRRATLDLLGLGVLDESEAESIPNASTVQIREGNGTTFMVEALPQMEVESVEVIEEDAELSIGRLAIAIKKASNIVELKAVYDANKHKIETNQFIKDQLKQRKNELLKG